MIWLKTKNCVRCFKLATTWSGHVLRDGKQIMAGWCDDCKQEDDIQKESEGFVGHYRKEMKTK